MTAEGQPKHEPHSLAAQMSRLEAQMTSLAEKVEDIKINVTQIAKLDKTIAEVVVHNGHARENIDQLWKAIADNRIRYESLDSKIDSVESATSADLNKAKGAGWALGVVFGVVQAFVIGSVIWVFSNVQESTIMNRLQQEAVIRMEAQLKDLAHREQQRK